MGLARLVRWFWDTEISRLSQDAQQDGEGETWALERADAWERFGAENTYCWLQSKSRVWRKTVRNLRQKFDVLEHSVGPFQVTEAMQGMFTNSCVRAAVHLDMDVDRSHRVLLNIDVATVEEVFTTVRMSGRESSRRRIFWCARPTGSDGKSLEIVHFAGLKYLRTTTGKSVCLRGCCSLSWRKMPAPSSNGKNW